ncbi:MAG TPA: glycosyltransferase family 2 protein [Bacillales bacterium]|nr:glycosyltransferase family 2 protein [Bacillales bacterium]
MVSIVTCTNRNRNIENIFENYCRQKWDNKELIVVLNDDQLKIKYWRRMAKRYPDVSVYQLPGKDPLGKCLNFAVKQAKYDIIAKFDDDDYYSPYYIPQAMKVFEEEEAEIVGKKVFYNYFKNKNLLGLRKSLIPVGGGTIMFRKEVFHKVQFPLKSHAEDQEFLKQCQKNRFNLCTTNPYNYVSVRDNISYHTWKKPNKKLIKDSYDMIKTKNYIPHITQEPSDRSS